jgi:shikimate kinase
MAFGSTRCAEMIGPAGSGKTTVLREVGASESSVAVTTNYRSVRRMPAFLQSRIRLARILGLAWAGPLTRRQRLWIWRLETTPTLLSREAAGSSVVFDQGPAFDLAMLADVAEGNVRLRRWWEEKVEYWASTFDAVFFLDAPDDVLVERIRARPKGHRVKELSDDEALAAVRSDRARYEEIVRRLAAPEARAVEVIRFDTSVRGPAEIAAESLALLGFERAA